MRNLIKWGLAFLIVIGPPPIIGWISCQFRPYQACDASLLYFLTPFLAIPVFVFFPSEDSRNPERVDNENKKNLPVLVLGIIFVIISSFVPDFTPSPLIYLRVLGSVGVAMIIFGGLGILYQKVIRKR